MGPPTHRRPPTNDAPEEKRPKSAGTQQEYDLTLCVSLISLFDFDGDRHVTQADWVRGTKTLRLDAMAEDEGLWELLCERFDTTSKIKGAIEISRIEDLVPIDPRVSLLLKAMFNSVASLNDNMNRATGKLQKSSEVAQHRVVLNMRRRIIEPVYSAWRDSVRRNRELRVRVIRRTLQRGMTRAWLQWAGVCEERKRLQRFMRRALSGGVSRALYRWLEALDEMERMRRFLKRLLNASVSRAWETWLESCDERRRMQRFMRRVLNAELVKGWNVWAGAVEEEKAKRQQMGRVMSRALNAELYKAWGQWASIISSTGRLRQFMTRILSQELSKAFASWLELLDDRDRMGGVLRRVMNAELARGWTAWVEMAEQAANQRGKMTSCITRALNRALVGALDRWAESAMEGRLMGKFGARLMKQGVSKAWASWTAMVEERGRMRTFAARIANAGVAKALGRWVEAAEEGTKLRGIFARGLNASLTFAFMRWSDSTNERLLMAKFGARLVHVGLTRAMASWCEMLEARGRMAKVMARALNSAVGKCFDSWCEAADEAAKAKWKLHLAVVRLLNQQVAAAFDSWLEMRQTQRRMKKYGARIMQRGLTNALFRWLDAADERRAKVGKMRKVVQRLRMAEVSRCMFTWAQFAGEGVEKARRMRSFLHRMLYVGVGKAWGRWMELLEEQGRMRKFIGRLLNAEVARAWANWLEANSDRKRMQRFLRRMMSRQVVMAWERWWEMIEKREKVRRIGFRLQSLGMVKAFNQWVDARRHGRRLAKVLKRMTARSLVRAWNQWADWSVAARRATLAMSKMLHRWAGGALAKGFGTWLFFVDEKARAMEMLNGCIRRMANTKKAAVVDAWCRVVKGQKEARRQLMRRAINRLRHGFVALCMECWISLIQKSQGSEEKLRYALNMMRERVLTQMFLAWAQVADTTRQMRRKYVARFQKALLTKAFVSWKAQCESLKGVKSKVNDVIQRLKHRSLVLTFGAWRDYIVHKAETMGETATRWQAAAFAKGFDRWKDFWLERRNFLDVGRRMILRYQNGLLAKCLLGWRQFVVKDGERQAQLQQRMMARMSGRAEMLRQLAFEEWHKWAAVEGERRKESAAKFYGRYQNQLLTKCYLAWSALTSNEREANRAKMLTATAFWSGRTDVLKRWAFNGFLSEVTERKRRREEVVHFALRRLRSGLLHVCFHAWCASVSPSVKLPAAPEDPAAGPVVQALQAEVAALRSQLMEVSKQMALQERTKAYRYEISTMRDELHSFLFFGGTTRGGANGPTATLRKPPGSDDEDDVSEIEYPTSPERRVRPRSGGPQPTGRPPQPPTARPRVRRPASARQGRAGVAAPHEWPAQVRNEQGELKRTTSPPVERPREDPASAPHRARPPTAGGRPNTADRRSPRVRLMSADVIGPETPHFSCSTAPISVPSGPVNNKEGLAWAQKSHFAMQLPPIS